MKKLSIFAALGLFWCSGICSFAEEPDTRPNIVMISVDDLNDWIGAFGGHPQIKTPNIDQLAKTSMVFRNTSCPGPVCGPSRSALLSGFMPATTGVYANRNNMLDSEIVQQNATLPEYFSKHGYLTISRGKIFHRHSTEDGADPGHWAFDIWEPTTGKGGVNRDKLYSRDKGIINGKKLKDPKFTTSGGSSFDWGPTERGKEETSDYQTALWFKEQLQKDYDKPFFMSVGISKPHLAWIVPQQYFDLYDLDTLEVPEFRMDDLDDIVDAEGNKAFEAHPDFLWCQYYGVMKEAVRAYMAATSYADECVGVVLEALFTSKYAKNTIVILWGDHGWHLGEKLRFRKATLWKESTQLPFMIYLPGMKQRVDCYRNVNLIDLFPTLIDLCGLPKKELDGKSIKPLLQNPELEWTPTVTTRGKGHHSVISEKWHYINNNDIVEELYDLENDPMEWTNLAQSDDPRAIQAKAYLKTFFPTGDVDEISRAKKKGNSAKTLDMTIKPKRILSELN